MSIREVIKIKDGRFTKGADIYCFYRDTVTLVLKSVDKYGDQRSLSGDTMKAWVSYSSNDAILVELTETNGISISADTATVTLDTSDLPDAGCYKYQIWMTDFVICQGNLTVSEVIE